MRRNIQWNLPETISLKLDSGMSWNVKMGRDGTGCYFARGWSKFVKDLKLEAWDFLIFRLIQEKEFEVAVYGVNCCEKDISCYASSGKKHSSELFGLFYPILSVSQTHHMFTDGMEWKISRSE